MLNIKAGRKKLSKRLEKVLFRPIDVFVFHSVSDTFDNNCNEKIDWTSTDEFKHNIVSLKCHYEFISLTEVFQKLSGIGLRRRRCAALTCDDGFKSILSVLPFLEEHQIPITLFVNPKYLDGVSIREGYTRAPKYITKEDLWALTSPLISIGMHGYEHNDATQLSQEDFSRSVDQCVDLLGSHPHFIPYYAYTWGKYSNLTQQVLKDKGLIPVLTSGGTNYRLHDGIDRKSIDGIYLNADRSI